MSKPVVLTLCDYYRPGYRAGGPITTLVNMVRRLRSDFDFKILTRDHDLACPVAYPSVVSNTWSRWDGADVCHLSEGRTGLRLLAKTLTCDEYDILYLNSLFSPSFAVRPLLLRRRGRIPKRPVVLAPRGEFASAALGQGRWKKLPYLQSAKLLGLYEHVTWQASSRYEEIDIRRQFGATARVKIAPDLTADPDGNDCQETRSKRPGRLTLLFLSRICETKNLLGALQMLKGVRGRIDFHIYGPMEDEAYWGRCQRVIRTLPHAISVRYGGVIRPDQVRGVIQSHDLFLLPTLGENFGHAIIEALSAGCPVLISDRTPWQSLKMEGVGWDLPLSRPDLFRAVLQDCVDMDAGRLASFGQRARNYASKRIGQEKAVQQNRELFLSAIRATASDRGLPGERRRLKAA